MGCPRPREGRIYDKSLLECSLGQLRQGLTGLRERVDASPIPVLERGRRAYSKSHRSRRERRQQVLEGSIFGCLVEWVVCAQGEHTPAPSAPSVLPGTIPGY